MGNVEGALGTDARPVDPIGGLEPGDGACAITIAIGIVVGLCDGEGLSDFWGACDEEGGIAIIDVGNGERVVTVSSKPSPSV